MVCVNVYLFRLKKSRLVDLPQIIRLLTVEVLVGD